MPEPRSFLYAPGDRPELLTKAVASAADAVIADLEDSVGPEQKEIALSEVVTWLGRSAGTAARWVRLDPARWEHDLAALAPLAPHGFVLPGGGDPSWSRRVAAALDNLGADDVLLAQLVEAATDLAQLSVLASAPRLRHLGMGEADLRADLGLTPGLDESELTPLRLQVVVASRVAGLAPPTGSASTDFRDLDALAASTERLQRLGFGARSAIHPAQLATIHAAFTPSEEDVTAARDTIARFEEARGGVTTSADGEMVDLAVVRRARQLLTRAKPAD